MSKYSEAQKNATNKYREGKATVQLIIDKELKQKLSDYAKRNHESINSILTCQILILLKEEEIFIERIKSGQLREQLKRDMKPKNIFDYEYIDELIKLMEKSYGVKEYTSEIKEEKQIKSKYAQFAEKNGISLRKLTTLALDSYIENSEK